MKAKGRYEVKVMLGHKVLERKYFNKINETWNYMDFIEDKKDKLFAIGSVVEFRDLDPFKPQI